MTLLAFTAIVFTIAVAAGLLGSLTGLGGGVVITPIVTLFLGVDIRYAIGASLVSVIATSCGAAAAYVRDGLSNIRVGMFLEIATTSGALLGAFLATVVPVAGLSILFGLVLLHAAIQTAAGRHATTEPSEPDPLAERLDLAGSYRTPEGMVPYRVYSVRAGFGIMVGAGAISGLLGIGSGSLKVIAMDRFMRLPFKVSTATSNFMIGVTAAASATVYLGRGYIEPSLAIPVMLGVLLGSMLGARLLAHLPVRQLRILFAVVCGVIAIQMVLKGFAIHA